MGAAGSVLVLAGVVAVGGLAQAPALAAAPSTYLVLTAPGTGADAAAARVQSRGGVVRSRFDAIGVLVATAERPDFGKAVVGGSVQSAAATTGLGARTSGVEPALVGEPSPNTIAEPLWAQQWDMRAIQVAEAHSVTTGSPDVVVGVLDTGIDDTHPDLASQVDDSLSVSCVGGVPDTSHAAWTPSTSDHGTHQAGIIAAALNGVGMVGVAPGVRLASVKIVNDSGFSYPEAVICGLMWAADHGFDVTNNGYSVDPWEFLCRKDPRQRPILDAVSRALRYATQAGVVTVASAGNNEYNLAATLVDANSPNDGSGPVETRTIGSSCYQLPAEAKDVITVASTGPTGITAFYANYGLGIVDVAAPGGDSRVPGSEPNGRVFSTIWPGSSWGYKQGTSMATAHVAGVAALVRSVHPNLTPAGVAALLEATADPRACPAGGTYTPPGSVVEHVCKGTTANNGFYGHGEVNAFRAVTE